MASFFRTLTRKRSNFENHGRTFTEMLDRELTLQHAGEGSTVIHEEHIQAVQAAKRHFDSFRDSEFFPPVLIQAPGGATTTAIVAMLPYVLECQKLLVISPSKIISKRLGNAFGMDNSLPSFFEATSKDEVSRAELSERFLEKVMIVDKICQINTLQMGNLIILDSERFGPHKANPSLFNEQPNALPNLEAFFGQFCTIIVTEAHHWSSKALETMHQTIGTARKRIIHVSATSSPDGLPLIYRQIRVYHVQNESEIPISTKVSRKRSRPTDNDNSPEDVSPNKMQRAADLLNSSNDHD